MLFKLFGLGQGWQKFLRACGKIVDNFWRTFLRLWEHEFTSTIFLIIPVMSASQAAAWLAQPLVWP
jgi:hypothetical protein